MSSPPEDPHARFRRSLWAFVIYLLGFAIFIAVISWYFLLPALDATRSATPGQKQQLSAYSLLLLAIVLLVILAGLVLTFRVSRYFFPRPQSRRTQTKYVDAWAESARRLDEKWEQEHEQP
jgi:hypothetical protein